MRKLTAFSNLFGSNTRQALGAVVAALCVAGCANPSPHQDWLTLKVDVPIDQTCSADTDGAVVIKAPPLGPLLGPVNVTCKYGETRSLSFPRGTAVTLEATLGFGERQRFMEYKGDCTGTNPVCTLTMDGDKAVTAKFCALIQ